MGPTVAAALAGAAALTLGVADAIWTRTDADESVSVGLFLLGWTLLAVAATTWLVCLVGLLPRLRAVTREDLLVLTAAVVLAAAAFGLHPPFGSGAG